MEKNFVLNGNKLIVEFMNIKMNNYGEYNKTQITAQGIFDTCNLDDLEYHKSWDWLMPCCKKAIDVYGYKKCQKMMISLKTLNINVVYKHLIEILS